MQPKISLTRIFSVLAALAIILLGLPFAVRAADPAYSLEVLSVKLGESVRVRAHNLPGNQLYAVLMDADGNQGVDGVRVDLTNAGTGGTFDETYKIPAALKNVSQLVIRLQSENGEYVVFASFRNKAEATPTVTFTPTPAANLSPTPALTFGSPAISGKPRLAILGVLQNQTVSLRATNFPAKQEFVIRTGPFETFFTDYVTLGRINSGQGGTFIINLSLPAALKDVQLITIRFDGGGIAVFNAFNNVTAGSSLTATPLPSPTAVPTLTPQASTPQASSCSVVSSQPSTSVNAGADFDAVWQVYNTSSRTWNANRVDYVFVSGAAGHKKTIYDLPSTLEPGNSLKIIADMRAPSLAGKYSETWAIQEGSSVLCTFKVNVTVK